MISVLIPTYNWDVYQLVSSLHKQLLLANVVFEIIVVDDASSSLFSGNSRLNELSKTSFEIFRENKGRSAIRNYLAEKANYSWLLFLDCDAIVDDLFMEKYINAIKIGSLNVVTGGMVYNLYNQNLRYKFGKKREEIDEKERNRFPEKYFFSANFMIRKEVFSLVKFDGTLKGYGYEDLCFAKELNKNTYNIKHIENPILHAEIDDNNVFLAKTKQALLNLKNLIVDGKLEFSDTRISIMYRRFYLLVAGLKYFNVFFEKLAVRRSSLFFFDLFRITYLCKMFKDEN
ncbi:Glycosyl transferase family 2 [Tenacibaculum sp. MAR_2009_124]|uniref:glycosyltransferase family 2 protein n=1 Tax=Tenacibaculum sp. MAR_2009_124 TaxID=1250059 RepID=UPI0008951CBF|nr:glycosyltransferase [Tenacibaculum sp. MAR_2009_124]SEC83367.1 Glycosyl transferase family 2 [Tenacibaculum sp. MAR_2009_124]